jgi:hypothetical protein
MTAERATKSDNNWKLIFGLFAVSNILLGAWMLVDPIHWYNNLPANVPATGPANEHFIRDVGCVFAVMGIALAVAAVRPAHRLPTLIGVTAWYVAHALVHVLDTVRGLLPSDQWLVDLPGVYGSALLLIGITIALKRSEAVSSS